MDKSLKAIEGKEGLFAVMDTTGGTIVLELYYKDAPLTVTNFVGLAEGTLDAAKGKKFYDGLPQDVQKILKEAAVESAKFQRNAVVEEEKVLFADVEKQGTKITTLTKEQKAAFQKAMAPVYDEYRGVLGKELVDKWVNATQGK